MYRRRDTQFAEGSRLDAPMENIGYAPPQIQSGGIDQFDIGRHIDALVTCPADAEFKFIRIAVNIDPEPERNR